MKSLLEKPLLGFSALRSLHYLIQYRSMYALSSSIPIFKQLPRHRKEKEREIIRELFEVLKTDVKNITDGVYPAEVLRPESVLKHWTRIPQILIDGLTINWRRENRQTKVFKSEAQEYLSDVPEYYRRNFHFQTDGYLSQKSAELYDHQVELLFGGAADAMRRMLLKPMKENITAPRPKILEIGCGTGSFTRFTAMTFPDAKVTAMDLSYPYLKIAKKRLSKFDRVEFIQGDGAHLPFQSESYDAVVTVFLFHELPKEERRRVLEESKRVLKKGGFFGAIDSIQIGDKKSLDEILERFPVDFHEPFYKSYVDTPMRDLIADLGFTDYQERLGFLSKTMWGLA